MLSILFYDCINLLQVSALLVVIKTIAHDEVVRNLHRHILDVERHLQTLRLEQQSTDVAAGEVISQNPEADTEADPDQPITIVVSSGNEAPAAQTDNTASAADTQTDNTAATQSAADTSAQQSAAVANGEVWKCTQTLNTPTGYQGGAIRLELIQEVNGEMTSTQVVNGEKLTFPYTLDITGAPGVSAGTLYVSEQVNGTYQQLGQYPITFQKAE